jgi:hypothetical protein
MDIIELQNKLIKDIQKITDEELLNTIYQIIHSGTDIYKLTPEQKESIRVSREQIKRGEFKSHETVMKETRKWLKKQ